MTNMLRPTILSSILVVIQFLLSCSSGSIDEKSTSQQSQTNLLYRDLKHVYSQYTDSIKQYGDSANVMRLIEQFEADLYSVYKKYPDNLDKFLTEGQNDTLWMLTKKFIAEKNRFTIPMQYLDTNSDTIPDTANQ